VTPLITWDVRYPGWQNGPREARAQWLKTAGLPVSQIYRAEFSGGSKPSARIFCYKLNGQNRKYWAPGHIRGAHDHDACHPAFEEPRDVPIDTLPPRELW
jgi:hypothetical protein